jgi:hypothetical protein
MENTKDLMRQLYAWLIKFCLLGEEGRRIDMKKLFSDNNDKLKDKTSRLK